MKRLVMVVLCLVSACERAHDFQMEACKKACAPNPVSSVTYDKCTCAVAQAVDAGLGGQK